MVARPLQTLFLAGIFAWDCFFFFNLYDYHYAHGDEPGHDTHYRPMYGLDNYRTIVPPATLMLWAHIFLAAAPLVLSLSQTSAFVRSLSLDAHRAVGQLTLVAALLSSVPALYLAGKIHDDGMLEHVIITGFTIAWIVSALMTWRTASNKNIAQHRRWAARFTAYTHVIPLMARIVAVPVYFYYGAPSWAPGRSSDPRIFPVMVRWVAAMVLPFGELCVWMEGWGAPKKKAPAK